MIGRTGHPGATGPPGPPGKSTSITSNLKPENRPLKFLNTEKLIEDQNNYNPGQLAYTLEEDALFVKTKGAWRYRKSDKFLKIYTQISRLIVLYVLFVGFTWR